MCTTDSNEAIEFRWGYHGDGDWATFDTKDNKVRRICTVYVAPIYNVHDRLRTQRQSPDGVLAGTGSLFTPRATP